MSFPRTEKVSMYTTYVVLMALAATLDGTAAAAAAPEWIGKERAQIRARRLDGGGDWTPTGNKRRASQRWSVTLSCGEDGDLQGSVLIENSPLLKSGLVRGSMRGRHLSGTIADAGGTVVAEFRGVVSIDGVRGTYTDRTGETGDWVWDGVPPQ
jgi:hypothetical protein